MAFQINYSLISSPGSIRTSNQDNLIFEGKFLEAVHDGTGGVVSGKISAGGRHIFGIFDGMGGHEKGEMASYIAAKAFSEYKMSESDITIDMLNCCINANLSICKYASENKVGRIGTTAVLAAVDKGYVHICNIGDSRLYIERGNQMKQVSVDHVTFAPYGKKAPLSQNLGIPETSMLIEPYTSHIKINSQDRFLLCSDGLTDMVPESQISEIISSQDPDDAVNCLYSLAMKNGGRDNITIIVFEVIDPEEMPGFGEIFKSTDPFDDTIGEASSQDGKDSGHSIKRKSSGMIAVFCAALLVFVLIAASIPLVIRAMKFNTAAVDKQEKTTADESIDFPVTTAEVQTSDDIISGSKAAELTTVDDEAQSTADVYVTNNNADHDPESPSNPSASDEANEGDANPGKPSLLAVDPPNAQISVDDDSPDEKNPPEGNLKIDPSGKKIGEDFLCPDEDCAGYGKATVYHEKDEVYGDRSEGKCYRYSQDTNYCEDCKTYYYNENGEIVNTQKPGKVREKIDCDYSNVDYTVTKEDTCTEAGEKTKVCPLCGHESTSNVKVIEALGHDWDNESPKPVSDDEGNYYICERTCTRCDLTEDIYKEGREEFLSKSFDSKEELTIDDFYKYLNDERTEKYCTKKYLENEYEKIFDGFDKIEIVKEDDGKVIAKLRDFKSQFEKLNDCYKIIHNKDDKRVVTVLYEIEVNLKNMTSSDEEPKSIKK